MSNFNLVVIMGRLTRDPELKYTPKGTAIANVSIAVNRKWKGESGDEKEETTFLDCVAFSKTAEVITQYLKKGNPIHISGRLRQESWEDKNTNEKRSKLGVVIESFQFLGSSTKSADKPKQEDLPSKPAKQPNDDDSVPF
jgi:single-strand DNA-binding protein